MNALTFRRTLRAAGFSLLAGAAGCVGAPAAEPVPARLVAPDDASRAELRRVLGDAIGRTDVVLAADALVTDGILLLERTPGADPSGHRLPGRDLGEPEHFRLLMVNDACVIEHRRTARRWVLANARCEPL